MHCLARPSAKIITAFVLAMVFAVPQGVFAQAHVVSPQDLQKSAVEAAQLRERNLQAVNDLLASPNGENAIKAVGADPQQIRTAVSKLSDRELADLASRAQKAQADFAAGRMNDHDLLIILIAIAALILIIVAVHH